jgi:hypothetical protein
MSRIVYLLGSAHFVGNFGNEHMGTLQGAFSLENKGKGNLKIALKVDPN